MKIEGFLTDTAILEELGDRLTQRRLELELTQAELAEQSGVSKRTVERIEAGATSQLSTLIRIFRALGLVDRLDMLVPPSGPRPMDLLKLKGKQRQRAPRKSKKTQYGDMRVAEEWKWGDYK